jgi:16S rRNA (guanine527-N7)-methyltransferase
MTRCDNPMDALSPEQRRAVEQYVDLFVRWNARINLSAARSADEVRLHVQDCLHVLPYLDPSCAVVDVGSGGGLPVIIAAICRPAIHFTALEPVHKKHAFLKTVARELGLSNLEAHAQRWEQHSRHDYDLAMSRASFDLVDWFTIGRQLVRSGGRIIGFEGVERSDLPAHVRYPYTLGGKQRAIVIVERDP